MKDNNMKDNSSRKKLASRNVKEKKISTTNHVYSKSSKNKSNKLDKVLQIWNDINDGKVNLTYAIAGYTYGDRLPIFNSQDLTMLLIQYGYDLQAIKEFIQDFVDVHDKNPNTPIVMVSANLANIYLSVKPINK